MISLPIDLGSVLQASWSISYDASLPIVLNWLIVFVMQRRTLWPDE